MHCCFPNFGLLFYVTDLIRRPRLTSLVVHGYYSYHVLSAQGTANVFASNFWGHTNFMRKVPLFSSVPLTLRPQMLCGRNGRKCAAAKKVATMTQASQCGVVAVADFPERVPTTVSDEVGCWVNEVK